MKRDFTSYSRVSRQISIDLIKFNEPNTWRDGVSHDSIMQAIREFKPNEPLYLYHFRVNEDGTYTPVSRYIEWIVLLKQIAGKTTIDLV